MKGLILLHLFISIAYAKECPSIDGDFRDYYGLEKISPIIGVNSKISDTGADKILCAQESCGSGGCECALYVRVDDCHRRVLEFRGSHQVLGEVKDGMPAIEIKRRGDAIAPAVQKTYIWNKDRNKYVEK